jgi:hypothetical protein
MEKSKHSAWTRHFDALSDEMLRLTTICDVNLREPGVIERVLHNDDTVCRSKNAIAFKKLRELLMAMFASIDKAVARLGTAETQKIAEEVRERLDERQAVARGGKAKKKPSGSQSSTT